MNHATVDIRTPAKFLQALCSTVEYELCIAHRPVWRLRCAGVRSWLRSHLSGLGIKVGIEGYHLTTIILYFVNEKKQGNNAYDSMLC